MDLKVLSVLLITFLGLNSCYTINQNEFDESQLGYYKYGSNTYTVWNVDEKYLTTDDSQCVTKSSATSIGDKVQEKISINCLEVMKLGKDRYKSKMFYEMLDNFFNSQTGMYFIASLLELL